LKLIIALTGAVLLLASCQKYKDVADADYPDQLIYMPAAIGGNYLINSISYSTGDTPTPGAPFRFTVDLANNKFIVPLSVYRSGVNNKGGFNVDIAVNTDTVTNLLTAGTLTDTGILPASNYSIPSSVNIPDGKEVISFDLVIDLNYLRTSATQYIALGVGVSSTERKSNPKLETSVVVIDTQIMRPIPDFTFSMDVKKVDFANNSQFSKNYIWDFGDGTATSSDTEPTHTYLNAGTYTVILKAIGITGDEDKSIKTATVTIL